MKIAFFDTHQFEREAFDQANQSKDSQITYFDFRLNSQTAEVAKGFEVVCSFVNDSLDAQTLRILHSNGSKLLALRSAGFNHVDMKEADRLGLPVVRVPEYSPYAIAEHALALMLTLNRKIHRAYTRVRELNFSLEGLVGFDMRGKTVGVVGTGRIGRVMVKILNGLGCQVLAYDLRPNQELIDGGMARYVDLPTIFRESDVLTLHVPLNPQTRHIIDANAIGQMKRGVLLINTGRGALIETRALVEALKVHRIGGAGLDVYEEEEGVFFHDMSSEGIADDLLARLLTFPNVVMTSHQGFLTTEALQNIAQVTLQNVADFAAKQPLKNQVRWIERK